MVRYYNEYHSEGLILRIFPLVISKDGVAFAGTFILTFPQFFYTLLGVTEMFLPSKILRMNPGQTEMKRLKRMCYQKPTYSKYW